MHDVLRERILRHLDALPEERLYQVADYIEFLSSKYARDQVRPASSVQRFGERLEEKLRGNRVGVDAIRGTLNVVGNADRVVSGLAQAGRNLLKEVGGSGIEPAAPPRPTPHARPRPDRTDDIPVDG